MPILGISEHNIFELLGGISNGYLFVFLKAEGTLTESAIPAVTEALEVYLQPSMSCFLLFVNQMSLRSTLSLSLSLFTIIIFLKFKHEYYLFIMTDKLLSVVGNSNFNKTWILQDEGNGLAYNWPKWEILPKILNKNSYYSQFH